MAVPVLGRELKFHCQHQKGGSNKEKGLEKSRQREMHTKSLALFLAGLKLVGHGVENQQLTFISVAQQAI